MTWKVKVIVLKKIPVDLSLFNGYKVKLFKNKKEYSLCRWSMTNCCPSRICRDLSDMCKIFPIFFRWKFGLWKASKCRSPRPRINNTHQVVSTSFSNTIPLPSTPSRINPAYLPVQPVSLYTLPGLLQYTTNLFIIRPKGGKTRTCPENPRNPASSWAGGSADNSTSTRKIH